MGEIAGVANAEASEPVDALSTEVVAASRVLSAKPKDARGRAAEGRKTSRMSVVRASRPSECAPHSWPAHTQLGQANTIRRCANTHVHTATRHVHHETRLLNRVRMPCPIMRLSEPLTYSAGFGGRSARASVAGGSRDGSVAGSKRGSMAGGAALQAQATAAALAAAGEMADMPVRVRVRLNVMARVR